MNLYVINNGHFKLDGGAMFGVVPKSLWNKLNPSDDNNLCSWAMRSLLVEEGNKAILIDNGMGNKQSDRFFSFYYLHGDDTLERSLSKAGFSKNDISDMFLTHLHFDHCGGSVELDTNGTPRLCFENAKYWSTKAHWDWAVNPNARERASFLKENILPIEKSGNLNFINEEDPSLYDTFDLLFMNGHTQSQMLPKISYKGHTIVFVADLIPSVGHIPLPYVMGYDTRPLQTMAEKEKFLKDAADNGYILFFEHDPINECCTVMHTEKGVRPDKIFPLSEIV